MQPRLSTALGYLFAAGFALCLVGGFAAGIGLSVWGISQIADGRSSHNWPTTEGTVVAAKRLDSFGNPFAQIEYAYVVDVTRFQ